MSHKILGMVTLLYLFVLFLHVLYFAVKKEKIISFMWIVLYVSLGLHTIGFVSRWVESYRLGIGHAPLSNFYESLIFYSWCIVLMLVIMKRRLSYPVITMLASVFALIFMGYASMSSSVDRNIQPLIPALQSNWLHIHVITCFISYAAFVISFICGLLYLINIKGIIPTKEILEEINYRSIMVGFPMLSAGILTGAVWAHYAWGSYWSWDPKETWSLITWIVYAILIHNRLAIGWRGRKTAYMMILGFFSILLTFFGVNLFIGGLHSYV